MKQLRAKLTYANVVSTLCLFLLVGGGAAFAANQLAKNSVGTKQLKKNAVTTAKIKKGAVTGAKVKLSSLGTVPSATHASSADSATTAKGLVAPEPVHFLGAPGEPSLVNGFQTFSSAPAGFYKGPECVVHLLGELEGQSGEVAFTLPPAYRPPSFVFPAIAVGGPIAGNVEIEVDGTVSPFAAGGGNHNYGLDGVTFRAASC